MFQNGMKLFYAIISLATVTATRTRTNYYVHHNKALTSFSFAKLYGECDDGNSVLKLTIPYSTEASVVAVKYGSCTEEDDSFIRWDQDQESHDFTIYMHSKSCDQQAALSFQSDIYVYIGEGDDVWSEYTVAASCAYPEDYIVGKSFGQANSESIERNQRLRDNGATVLLRNNVIQTEFEFKIYTNDSFTEVDENPEFLTGNTVHIGLSVANQNWNYGIRKHAPLACTIKDRVSGKEMVLFDYRVDNCSRNGIIGFKMHYEQAIESWAMSHTLFVWFNENDNDDFDLYTECNVRICDSSDKSAGDDECTSMAKACLDETAAIQFAGCKPEPCQNSHSCIQNTRGIYVGTGFTCDCGEFYGGDYCEVREYPNCATIETVAFANLVFAQTLFYPNQDDYKYHIRLVNGDGCHEGRIEISNDRGDTWGTVCDDQLDGYVGPVHTGTTLAAHAICKQLGYTQGAAAVYNAREFGSNYKIGTSIDELTCPSEVDRIDDCIHDGWGTHNCQKRENAGISCIPNEVKSYEDLERFVRNEVEQAVEARGTYDRSFELEKETRKVVE